MDDDDDIPDELLDILDTIADQKNQTISQAPTAFLQPQQQQQHQARNGSSSSGAGPGAGNAQWRAPLVQQLPSAAPPKPMSLAQQLLGANSTSYGRPPPGAGFHGSSSNPGAYSAQGTQQQRWAPPTAPQQQQAWSSTTVPSQFQQQQQQQKPPWQLHQQTMSGAAGVGPSAATPGTSASAALAAGIGLPPLGGAGASAAVAAGDAQLGPAPSTVGPTATPAPMDATGPTGMQQQPQQVVPQEGLQRQLQQLQFELQQQANRANQLQYKLAAAEQERLQMQQRLNTHSQPQHSLAQQRAQELQKQAASLQQQRMFAEQEALEAQKKAADREAQVKQAEQQVRTLQDEVRRKEDLLMQLQVELEQEKQRTERLAAAAAAGGSTPAGGPSSSSLQPHMAGFTSPAPPGAVTANAAAGAGMGSSGKQRKGGTTPAAAGRRTPRVMGTSTRSQLPAGASTPQQWRAQQMTQLLKGTAGAESIDLDMYEDVPDDNQQQQQEPCEQQAAAQVPEQLAPTGQGLQQPPQGQQQQHQAAIAAGARASSAAGVAGAASVTAGMQAGGREQQHVPQKAQAGILASKMIPALQRVQISQPQLPQLLWSTCQPSMQQLLQPLPAGSGFLTSPGLLPPGATVPPSGFRSNLCEVVPAALSAVQQQLKSLTAGVSSSGSALLLKLLQLAAVLIPAGGTSCNSEPEGDGKSSSSEAAAAIQPALPAASQQQQQLHAAQARWLLLSQSALEQPSSVAGGDATMEDWHGSGMLQQQQHGPGLFLVFRSTGDAQMLHILPLHLAAAVLELLGHLIQLDDSCLQLVIAHLAGTQQQPPHTSSSKTWQRQQQQQVQQWKQQPNWSCRGWQDSGLSSSASSRGSGPGCNSQPGCSRVRVAQSAAGAGEGSTVRYTGEQQQQLLHSGRCRNSFAKNATEALFCAPADLAVQAALAGQGRNKVGAGDSSASLRGSSSSSEPGQKQGQHHHTLPELLWSAATCHNKLLVPVGVVLAALAGRLPLALRPLLLPSVLGEQRLLLLLLQADDSASRCQAASLLQQLLTSLAVQAAFAAALVHAADASLDQQKQDDDVVMIDVTEDVGARRAALQPLNHKAADTSGQAGIKQQHQQPASVTACTLPDRKQPVGTAAGAAAAAIAALRAQAVHDTCTALLDCFSFGLEQAFQEQLQPAAIRQHSQQDSSASSRMDAQATGSSNSVSRHRSRASRGCQADGAVSSHWGVFELQRRCCAIVANLLHNKQEPMLQLMMDQQATAGFGLAQRLLVMVDAACSPVGGDPFAALSPLIPGPAMASTAAAANTGTGVDASSSICGAGCTWDACLERVQLCHEALLLLRALVATPGAVGNAAMSDLCSNTTSLRLIMTTRAKLAELTEALLAAAAARAVAVGSRGASAAGQAGASSRGSAGSGAAAATSTSAAAATALSLEPWAWPWSAHCGCKASTSRSGRAEGGVGSSGSSSSSVTPGQQLLHVQRPPLQTVLQEMSNSAASVHRRVMIFLKSQEAAMQP